MHRYNPLSRLRNQGFTLIESLIIVFVIGVVAVIATPSFGQMLDSYKLEQSAAEVRVTLSAAQRQAIRNGASCEVGVLMNQDSTNENKVLSPSMMYTECVEGSDEVLPENTIVVSNLKPLDVLEAELK